MKYSVFNEKSNPPAMLGRIVYVETVRISIKNLLCYIENGVASKTQTIAGAVCIDHVHLSVVIPPKLSISNFMGYLKGKSTLMIYDRHPELQSKWDKAFGA